MFWEFHIMHPSPTHLSISISTPHHCSVPSLKEALPPHKKINLKQSKQVQVCFSLSGIAGSVPC